ncbi:MAG: GGDEF domain-containing protein [Myxococcales bacterium FL481]|nr:MAG: GGDEF domain-containing protein [Myxococcales bacterium FL481]
MRDETIVTVIRPKLDDSQSGRRRKEACFVVIYGTSELGRKYNIEGSELNFGRGTGNDIILAQDAVSRQHATVTLDESGVKIRDNDSTNGTYVNDIRVRSETYLQDGDLLKIGRSIFKFLSGDNIESSYHEEIFRLSTMDGLTGVYNRRYFMETLERELSRARRYQRPLALMLFDIDHFKLCNDRFGHRAGDYVLQRLAALVQSRARKVDVVARYGGEEFAVILPEIGLEGAARFAEELRGLIEEEPFVFERERIPVTVSLGVAELDSQCSNADDLIALADRRLYGAKQSGRNRVVAHD